MKRTVIALLLVLVLAGGMIALAAAGDANDPLISLSYLLDTFRPAVLDRVSGKMESALEETLKDATERTDVLESKPLPTSPDKGQGFSPVSLQNGERLQLAALTAFVPMAGSARLSITAGELIDLSTGTIVPNGSLLRLSHRYLAAENAVVVLKAESGPLSGMAAGSYTQLTEELTGIAAVFPDLHGHWSSSYVETLYARGVVNGIADGVFSPNGTVTRAMLVTILGRVEGIAAEDYSTSHFSDVTISRWYGPYVAWAENCGIVQGYEDGSFRPENAVTREQMALIFRRYVEYKALSLPETETALFADDAYISPWARDAVEFVQRAGLMNGKDGNAFDPRGTATRAEICAVTARFLEKAGLA